MTNATFQYDIDEKVMTAFGSKGIVNMLALDDGRNNLVFVKTSDNSQWLKESELTHGWGG